MDNQSASLFLEGLLERIDVDPQTGKYLISGYLSTHEVSAIKIAVSQLKSSQNPCIKKLSLAEWLASPKGAELNQRFSFARDKGNTREMEMVVPFNPENLNASEIHEAATRLAMPQLRKFAKQMGVCCPPGSKKVDILDTLSKKLMEMEEATQYAFAPEDRVGDEHKEDLF